MPTPLDLNSGIIIQWNIPTEIRERNDINFVKIYRSQNENSGYSLLSTLNFPTNQIPTSYRDQNGSRSLYYLVTFGNSQTNFESNYHLTYKYPTPSELKIINMIKSMTPDVLKNPQGGFGGLTDEDYIIGMNLALQYFNSYPPQTYFTIESFPKNYQFLLVGLAFMFMVVARYLPVSVRDWTYSEPGGVTLVVDRGAKFQQAIEIIQKTYGQFLNLIKMDLSIYNTQAFGTIPLPLSLGGMIPAGITNILNVFTSIAR